MMLVHTNQQGLRVKTNLTKKDLQPLIINFSFLSEVWSTYNIIYKFKLWDVIIWYLCIL